MKILFLKVAVLQCGAQLYALQGMLASCHVLQVHTNISCNEYGSVQVRDGVLAVLDAWASIAAPDKPALAVADAIASGKATPDGKVAGLKWLAALVAEGRCSADAVQKVAAAAAGDRSAEVREAATTLTSALAQVRNKWGAGFRLGACMHASACPWAGEQAVLDWSCNTAFQSFAFSQSMPRLA